jgi:hypothetical protein
VFPLAVTGLETGGTTIDSDADIYHVHIEKSALGPSLAGLGQCAVSLVSLSIQSPLIVVVQSSSLSKSLGFFDRSERDAQRTSGRYGGPVALLEELALDFFQMIGLWCR